MAQESGSSLTEWVWLRLSREAAVRWSAGAAVNRGPASSLAHSHTQQVRWRKSQFFARGPLWTCLSVLTTWPLASLRASDTRESRGSPSIFSNLISEVAHYLLEASHWVQPTLKERRLGLHLLKEKLLKTLWTYFETSILSHKNC